MDKVFDAYVRCFDFEGRSSRTEYFAFSILNIVVYFVLFSVMFASSSMRRGGMSGTGMLMLFLMAGFSIASFIPWISVTARRFHDQGRSGWMMLLGFVPYVGGIVVLVFMCLRGDDGSNAYGEDPR